MVWLGLVSLFNGISIRCMKYAYSFFFNFFFIVFIVYLFVLMYPMQLLAAGVEFSLFLSPFIEAGCNG